MEISTKNVNMSDDEEDLELLRLAALQTIKKPVINNVPHQQPQQPPPPTFNKIRRDVHRGRTHFSGPGRGGRGIQFNGRVWNTNLISIPTVQADDESSADDRLSYKRDSKPAPKLILPQDRYCNKTEERTKSKEVSSKFSRYDHSDKSDSEDESESERSEGDGEGKLERTSSLEALMQELEYEISGGEKPKEKVKKRKAKRRQSENEATEEEKPAEEATPVEAEAVVEERLEVQEKVDVEEKVEVEKRQVKPSIHRKRSPLNGSRRHNRHFHRLHRNGFGPNYTEPPPHFAYTYPPNIPYIPPNPYQAPPQLLPLHQPNYIIHRPLSPLNLNTEVLSTIAMAPLSPRSAAFVLQNREIIERRKKSPRRSYSRSPSPRFRPISPPYTANCSRSHSPRRYTRSASPKRSSPVRKVTRNTPPRKTSPLRPVKTNTLEQKESPKSRKTSPKPSIKDRLGAGRTHKPEEVTVKVEDSKVTKPRAEIPQPPTTDSVLEARKRKFEEKPEVTVKEGIIRLKPKLETPENPVENKAEEDVDDLLDLNINDAIVDTLFSDEESDNENEGRFKLMTSTKNREKVAILPFTQLSNRERDVMLLSLDHHKKDQHCRRDRDHHNSTRDRRRRKRASTPPPRSTSSKIRKSEEDKGRTAPKRERKTEHDSVLVVDNKKAEGRSHGSEIKVVEKDATKREGGTVRKVAIAKSAKENDDLRIHDVPEVIVDEEDNDINVKNEAGDLRAQLSRKRAERQHKLPVAEDVQSRLLQNALQGAVFKKAKKLKKEKEAAPKDKVPIHMRLGLAKETDGKRKETKRRKKKARSSEQV